MSSKKKDKKEKKEKKWSRFEKIIHDVSLYDYASNVMAWDANVSGAPDSGADMRADAMGMLSELYYNKVTGKKVESIIEDIDDDLGSLNTGELAAFNHFKTTYKKIKAIPVDEYSEYTSLCSKSEVVWVEARKNNDFNQFKPYLEKIIDFNKRFVEYRGYEGHPYNTLLDDFEPGVTVDTLDGFFELIKTEISPIYKSKEKGMIKPEIMTKMIPISAQRDYTHRLVKLIGYDPMRGVIAESPHPFSMGLNNGDVRITTSYDQTNFFNAIFSSAHEAGHAIFEQNTMAGKMESFAVKYIPYALHESQSRFYENHVAKTRAFFDLEWKHMAQYLNPKLKKVSSELAYTAANALTDTTIRIDSDELSYPLHIIIRYEIEKGIFEGTIKIKDLPEIWNEKTKEYLGVVPENDSKGILQDIHWAGGSFGYFPSYALGSAYSAQFNDAMNKSFSVEAAIRKGDFESIKKWLGDNVHVHGGIKTSSQILKDATGESFNPKYYVDYLKGKFEK